MAKKKFSDDTLATIRQVLKQQPHKWLNVKQIIAKLPEVSQLSFEDTEYALEQLVEAEQVAFQDYKYQFLQDENVAEGVFLSTKSGLGFVKIENTEDDILIEEKYQNVALHGDIVLVKLIPTRAGRRQEGKIVEVLKRTISEFVGYYFEDDGDSFMMPANKNLDIVFYIPELGDHRPNIGDKITVKITHWDNRRKNPRASITKVLGKPGDHHAEMHSILAEFGFTVEFPPEVQAEADALPKEITATEIAKRRDLRKVLTFTIDPEDAKDFDDALSIQQLENGRYEIGIHIADVSHYVLPNTLLDKEAFKRATSVYLVDRTVPMLPEVLSNFLCSLRPHEDKLTFSAIFEMDEEGNIYKEWVGRTIIHSDHRFSYESAQEVLETNEGLYATELKVLNTMAKSMTLQRYKAGAISFETGEVKFKLDENYKPVQMFKKVRKDAHRLIEEFMLLANKKVTEFAYNQRKNPRNTFVYRIHDNPDPQKLEDLQRFVALFGFKLGEEAPKKKANKLPFMVSSKQLQALMEQVEDTPAKDIIRSYAVRSMAKARYTTENTGHYGLAFPLYTHFTSPIRRYPDVMVHRLIQHYLDNKPSMNQAELEKQSVHCSAMEKKASEAERASIKYKQAEYLKEHIGSVYSGIVSGVTEWGIYVEIEEMRCEGMISLQDMSDDHYEFNDRIFAVVGKRSRKSFRMGDALKVRVVRVSLEQRTIDFELYREK